MLVILERARGEHDNRGNPADGRDIAKDGGGSGRQARKGIPVAGRRSAVGAAPPAGGRRKQAQNASVLLALMAALRAERHPIKSTLRTCICSRSSTDDQACGP